MCITIKMYICILSMINAQRCICQQILYVSYFHYLYMREESSALGIAMFRTVSLGAQVTNFHLTDLE